MTGFAVAGIARVPSSSFVRLCLVAAALAFPAATAPVHAADKAAARPAGAASPGDRVMSPAQLKACLDQRERMREKVDAVQKERAGVDADKAEIERDDKALGDALATVDRTKAEEVDAYNERVKAHGDRVRAFQQRANDYNARAEAARGVQEDYARSCENRRYDDRDLADIQRNKK